MKRQISLLREIHEEVESNIFKYLAIENRDYLESARSNILMIKDINDKITDWLTSEEAKDLIFQAKMYYKHLNSLLEKDDSPNTDLLKFNWLED